MVKTFLVLFLERNNSKLGSEIEGIPHLYTSHCKLKENCKILKNTLKSGNYLINRKYKELFWHCT